MSATDDFIPAPPKRHRDRLLPMTPLRQAVREYVAAVLVDRPVPELGVIERSRQIERIRRRQGVTFRWAR